MENTKWYGLYRDGELIAVINWYGVPTQADFRVGGLLGSDYVVCEVEVEALTNYPA